jgi:hypothetical protein
VSKQSSKYKQPQWHKRDDAKLLKELERELELGKLRVFLWCVATLVAVVLGLWLVFTFARNSYGL